MSREYSFNLTVPLSDVDVVTELLQEAKRQHTYMRISRKPDRNGCARFYLSFPMSGSRPDLAFQEWLAHRQGPEWDLYGPTHGRWGLV